VSGPLDLDAIRARREDIATLAVIGVADLVDIAEYDRLTALIREELERRRAALNRCCCCGYVEESRP
jgi:hypothetical protein